MSYKMFGRCRTACFRSPNLFAANKGMPLQASVAGGASRYIIGTASVLVGAMAGFYIMNSRSAIHEYVSCPLVRLVTPDAEDGHKLGIWFLKYGLAPKLMFDKDDPVLKVEVFGKTMSNPIGCAAGLDKDGEAIDGIAQSGFGYVEIGTVTPLAQPGNPKPRFFRLPMDEAVINRYGFNSSGHKKVYDNVLSRVRQFLGAYFRDDTVNSLALYKDKLLGINLGKNKNGDEVEDYLRGVEKFQSLADVLVINVSSPNTPGLRDLQQEGRLTELLSMIVAKRNSLINEGNVLGASTHKPPVLVKIAPDLTEPELQSIAEAAKKSSIDGIIVSNTTIQRPDSLYTVDEELKNQAGGLSGKPVKPFALKALRTIHQYTKDTNLVLVGCGGISSGQDAIEFAKAGAHFVQLYTAYAYRGPGLIARIKDEVTEELRNEGKTWMEIIGQDAK
ncbi:ACL035Cp [Eremothecium gossypii ATCC 10895]|uniref:Dihydroorotate dehydrogenase (quinone), mitochondrial n=1 Tax=Eremothecium gossypii (strain ATCC 10895 / CBS 109.51 / FGSC 9923 / NRRL Y-1056) TaxID=284811 RepID=PYRD_EREGS|nr:ACL035Cp [Eremothecium gossypii ATCC 10895]Q75CE1.1 RecName: Full=Dihydroorotate dehydrogenase (quinone), mitochondrial; Short=DHOD; Short=DHODase; Short=DHOdehase; AltName: Full=Dihydroorotate oxidase; Flags: Precursor [Eremothecium gossypii ATCC 10895]AAS51193.1 ACL035Cp [Eremothecium gossypii ATCC 10895]AEY95484.1 FACL035Cp [Eremothecium gossypii FDAG1]